MANQKVPQLPILTAITDADLFYVVDVSDTTDDPTGSSKQVTREELLTNISYLEFNTTATTTHAEGRISWNNDIKSLEIDTENPNVQVQVGHEMVVRVNNQTGDILTKGTVVYINGEQGQRPTVTKADYSGDSSSASVIGLVAADINDNNNGYVVTSGILEGLNTVAYSAGTSLYLFTGGTYSNNKPQAPDHDVRIGKVIVSNATTGSIYVNVQNGYELDELHDVRITSATTNDMLVRSSYNGIPVWVNTKTLSGLTYVESSTISATTISATTVTVSGNSSSDLVRITQTGSGNALVVEDENNPDSSPFVVNTSGFVGIGVTSPTNPLHISGSTDQIKLSNGSSTWSVASKSNGDFVAVASGTRASMYFGSYGATNSVRIGSNGAIIVNSPSDSQFTGNGNVIINNGLSATTISATTYQNLPIDVRVTGGTYSSSTGEVTLTNNTGGTFSVSGFFKPSDDIYVTGGTYSNGNLTFTNKTGGTFSVLTSTNYAAGVISGATYTSTGTGQVNLPAIKVALYNNANNIEPIIVYDVASGTTGSGGLPSLVDQDTNYIVVEYNGGTPRYYVYDNDGVVNDSSVVLFMIVYRLGNFVHTLEFGNQGAGLANKLNDRFIMTDRFGWESGLSLGLSGSTGVVTTTEGVAWNASYRQALTAVNSQDDVFFKNFHSGGTWTYTTTGDTLNNTYYDNGTNIVDATGGKYLVNWYFRGQEVNDHLYEVYGNNEYDSVAEAELSVEPLLPELITSHAFLLGRIIVLKSETTGVTQSAFVRVFQSTQVDNHEDLLGLQGGGPGEYYHLTSSQYNNIPYKNSGNTFTQGQVFTNGVTANTITLSSTPNTNNSPTQLLTINDTTGDVEVTSPQSPGLFNYGLVNAIMTGNFLT